MKIPVHNSFWQDSEFLVRSLLCLIRNFIFTKESRFRSSQPLEILSLEFATFFVNDPTDLQAVHTKCSNKMRIIERSIDEK